MPLADLVPHPSESPIAAHNRVARELLDELTEIGGGLIVSIGPVGERDNPLYDAIARAANERGDELHLGNADKLEERIPLSFLERFAARNPWADEFVAAALEADDPLVFARLTIDYLLTEHESDPRITPHVVINTDAQWIDEASAVAVRYMLPRLMYRGVILVFGVAYGETTSFIAHILDIAMHDPRGRFVELPMLRAVDVQRHFASRFGFPLGMSSCQRVVEWSSGLLADADRLLDEITPEELEGMRDSRTLPNDVLERAATFSVWPLQVDPELRVYAEICALVIGTIGRDSFTRVCRRLGALDHLNAAIMRGVVVQRPNGDIALAVPRAYQTIIDSADPAQLRRIHRALADEGVSLVGVHRLYAIEHPTEQDFDDACAYALSLDRAGNHREASIVYRSAQIQATDPAIESSILQDGLLMHVRRRIQFESDNFLADVDRLVPEPARTYIRLWTAYLSPRGADHVGKDRIDFFTAPSVSDEHRWLQLDIALLHGMHAYSLGIHDDADLALSIGYELANRLDDPAPPRYFWMTVEGRRLAIEALRLGKQRREGSVEDFGKQLTAIAERARELPEGSADRACTLAICGILGFFNSDPIEAHLWATEATTSAAAAPATCPFTGDATVIVAIGAIHDGEWALADAVLSEALPSAFASVERRTRVTVPMVTSYLESARGKTDQARILIEAAREQLDERVSLDGFGDFMVIAECEYLLHTEDPRTVIERTDEHLREGRFLEAFGLHLFRTEAFALIGDGDAAMESFEHCRRCMRAPFTEQGGFLAHAEGAALRAYGDLAGAEAALRHGLALTEAPLELGKCEVTLARTLGASEEAMALLGSAERRFSTIGAAPYLRFVREVRKGIVGTKQQRIDALTPRELQIARLAAQGMTNPEISDEVGISRSTVAFHISKILEKLVISSRREIGETLDDQE